MFFFSLPLPLSLPPLPFFSTRFDQNWLWEVFCFLFHVVVLAWLVLSAYWTNSFFLSVCHCLSSFFFCDRRRMKMTETWLLIVRCPSRIDSPCLCADENINAFSLNFDILLNWWKNLISSHGSIFDLNECRLITYFHFLDGLCPCVREAYFTSIWMKFLAL